MEEANKHQRFGATATPNKGIMFISDLVSVHRIFTRPVCPVVQRSGLDPATCHCPFGPFLLGEHHHVPKIIETVQTSCLGLVPVWVDRVVTNHWRSNLPLCLVLKATVVLVTPTFLCVLKPHPGLAPTPIFSRPTSYHFHKIAVGINLHRHSYDANCSISFRS